MCKILGRGYHNWCPLFLIGLLMGWGNLIWVQGARDWVQARNLRAHTYVEWAQARVLW